MLTGHVKETSKPLGISLQPVPTPRTKDPLFIQKQKHEGEQAKNNTALSDTWPPYNLQPLRVISVQTTCKGAEGGPEGQGREWKGARIKILCIYSGVLESAQYLNLSRIS